VVSTAVTRALRVLKTFTLQLPDGTRVSIDVEALRGVADSGNLADDVTDLLVACGDAARDRGTGIVLAVDELQYVPAEELSALIVAIHRTNQLNLPVILTGAGLPQLRALVGEAKSYAERLFDFPEIGSLGAEDARTATRPPRRGEWRPDRRRSARHHGRAIPRVPVLPPGVGIPRLERGAAEPDHRR